MPYPPLPATWTTTVVDTNVLISAALVANGAPARLVDRLLAQSRLVFSELTFAELETRIWKPKFDRYVSLEVRRSVSHDFSAAAFWVSIKPELAARTFSRDPSDDAFVHAALAAEAGHLISGDDDLLCLHPLGELQILTPRAALTEIGE